MPKITNAGTYLVTINNAHYVECKGGLQAVLPGVTESKDWIEAYLTISSVIIKSGKNQGSSWAEITMETLELLGMGKDPNEIDKLNGKQAQFVVAEDQWEGNITMKVKFVNPPSRPQASKQTITECFKALGIWSKNDDLNIPPKTDATLRNLRIPIKKLNKPPVIEDVVIMPETEDDLGF